MFPATRSRSQYFLYSPGSGVSVLPAPPRLLNNNGDILFDLPGTQFAQYIQTASGQIPLPSGYFWVSINDSDEAVGYATAPSPPNTALTSVYFSVGTGVVDLSTRIVNPGAYIYFLPAAINNRGQIAVNYMWSVNPNIAPYEGVGLLEPVAGASGQRSVLRLPRPSPPRTYRVNGVPVETVK